METETSDVLPGIADEDIMVLQISVELVGSVILLPPFVVEPMAEDSEISGHGDE